MLDGIPLAIELAAARLGALTLDQLAARVDDALRLLVSGSRTALPRHKTLRGTLEWSYRLLSAREVAAMLGVPERTVREVKEDVEWLKQQTK